MKKRPFEKVYRPFSKDDVEFVGNHIEKNHIPYLLIAALVAIFEIVMIVRGILFFDFAKSRHVAYFSSYFFLLLASIGVVLVLSLFKRIKGKYLCLYLTIFVYAIVLFVWGFLVSYVDMEGGHSPIVFSTIVVASAGIMLLNPILYNSIALPTTVALIIVSALKQFDFFASAGDYINLVVFNIMALIINSRLYRVYKKHHIDNKTLAILNVTDALTGLGNEAAYLNKVRELEESIENGKEPKFRIVMMDVNNLKVTNDAHGHRFGCHLIVEAGHILPTIFKHSSCFHVGGDEFIVIVEEGYDYDHFDEVLETFKEKLEYQKISYFDVDLILSLALGHATHKDVMKYSDVLQMADKAMYENKKSLKEKYNFKGR